MNKFTKHRKFLKYRALRLLPGRWGRHYDRKLRRILQVFRIQDAARHSQGKTNIDLGANLGVYTKLLSPDAKQVIAFEPDPWTCAELRKNISYLENVRIENLAAGVSDNIAHLYRLKEFEENPAYMSVSSTLMPYGEYFNADECVEVRQVDFIGYLDDLDEDIGVLKIDIEGAEIDILEALFGRPDLLERIDFIFAEMHDGIPGLAKRAKALRERAGHIVRPEIDLEWR